MILTCPYAVSRNNQSGEVKFPFHLVQLEVSDFLGGGFGCARNPSNEHEKGKTCPDNEKNVQDKSSQARKPMKVRLEWFLSQEKKRFAPNLNSKDLQSSGTRVEREGKSTKKPTRLDLSTTICLLSIWLSVAIKNILICSFSTV